jgi:hypothetical protein
MKNEYPSKLFLKTIILLLVMNVDGIDLEAKCMVVKLLI